jgi:hypothetical protein
MYRVDLQGQLYPREYDMFLLFWNVFAYPGECRVRQFKV